MGRRILIADDEANIVTALRFMLERNGFEVAVAENGAKALAAMASFAPDLVLLDVMMPVKNGFEVCQDIRGNPDWRDVKIVMLTAKGRDVDVAKGRALGADAYVTKPFSTRELAEQVKALLAT